MTASLAAITAASVATTVTTVAPATPSGSNNDLIVAFSWANTATATWAQATFVPSANSAGVGGSAVLYRIADGTEGGTITFTRATNVNNTAGVILMRVPAGTFDPVNPIDTVTFAATAAGTTIDLATQSPTGADNLLVQAVSKATTAAVTWTPPGTAFERADAAAAGTGCGYAVGDEVVGAGPTGIRTWTQSGTAAARGAMISVNPFVPNSSAAFFGLL